MNIHRANLLRLSCGTALVALISSGATAQVTDQGVEQVEVTSTRLQAAGFDAPTPTTVISSADLEKAAQPNVFDAIVQLPALQGSAGQGAEAGSTSTGLQGLSAFGLRGLSPLRTLVLLDGQRVVGANFNGVVDASQLPQVLIQRVDVVTGGASASWGSDAIAGVVNIITDKRFVGVKGNFSSGISTYGDDENATAQLAAGTSFAGGRGHFEVSGEYSYSAGLHPDKPQQSQFGANPTINGRDFNSVFGIANYGAATATSSGPTPAGQPQMFFGAENQTFANAAYGLITNGPKIGTTFGANSVAMPFYYAGNCTPVVAGTKGSVVGSIGGTCFGTPSNPGSQTESHAFTQTLLAGVTRGNVYARASYDLTPDTEIYADMTYGEVRTYSAPGQPPKSQLSIHCDNAYLPATGVFGINLSPAATQAACLADYPGNAIQYGTLNANLPIGHLEYLHRSLRRYVVGGDGTFDFFGKKWKWESYFQHGETGSGLRDEHEPLKNRYNLALDAIQLPSGEIACRNVAARSYGCVPINTFGNISPSPAAIAYIDNETNSGTLGPTAVTTQRQEAFSLVFNGAPFETWAGPVAVATGYEYREEYFTQRGDPYSAGLSASTPATYNEPCTDPSVNCVTGDSWNAGNFHNGRGSYHVNEAFVEFGVPLLDDRFWGKLDLSLAGRMAHYSTAGQANTWKVGATWDTPIPGVRARALMSRDIRAPNLSELFAPTQAINGNITNRFVTPNVPNQNIHADSTGNTELTVEKAQTTELGLVYQPEWFPGFQASVDYYRISVKGVVSALKSQNIVDLCFGGNEFYCQQNQIATANGVNVSTQNPGLIGQPNEILAVYSRDFNAASLVTDGFDIEASYDFDLETIDVPGSLQLRMLANHTSKFIANSGIPGTQINTELAGVVADPYGSSNYNQSGGNILTWKLTATQSYQNDLWGVTLTERWFAPGTLTAKNTLVCDPGTCPAPTIQTPTINYNSVDSAFYLDVGANWNIRDSIQLYAKVDNVANLLPPNTGSLKPNPSLYDVVGRMYRIGVRFSE